MAGSTPHPIWQMDHRHPRCLTRDDPASRHHQRRYHLEWYRLPIHRRRTRHRPTPGTAVERMGNSCVPYFYFILGQDQHCSACLAALPAHPPNPIQNEAWLSASTHISHLPLRCGSGRLESPRLFQTQHTARWHRSHWAGQIHHHALTRIHIHSWPGYSDPWFRIPAKWHCHLRLQLLARSHLDLLLIRHRSPLRPIRIRTN